jgi:hypothetical protein
MTFNGKFIVLKSLILGPYLRVRYIYRTSCVCFAIDLERGVERLRRWLHAMMTGNDDMIAAVDEMIHEMVTERNEMNH